MTISDEIKELSCRVSSRYREIPDYQRRDMQEWDLFLSHATEEELDLFHNLKLRLQEESCGDAKSAKHRVRERCMKRRNNISDYRDPNGFMTEEDDE